MAGDICAVIGAGAMGHGIAQVLAGQAGTVRLYDPDRGQLELAQQRIDASLRLLQRHRLITAAQAARTRARIGYTGEVAEAVAEAWFVIEAAPELLEVKQPLLAELDRLAPAAAIIATNSSGFTIAQVTEQVAATRAPLLCGSHFFLPAQLVPLVEVSRTAATADSTMDRVVGLWAACGKAPVRVEQDISGYIANRMQAALGREAVALIAEGVASAADIDRAVQLGFGLRYLVRGPTAQRDVAGLTLASRIDITGLADPARHQLARQHIADLVAAGASGLDAGRGFHDWSGQDPAQVRSDGDEALVRALVHLGLWQAPVTAITDRTPTED